MTNPAAAELFPGSLAWSIAGAAWSWLLSLLLGASLVPFRSPEAGPGADLPHPAGGRLLAWAVVGQLAQALVWLLLSTFGVLRPVTVVATAAALAMAAGALGGRRVVAAAREWRAAWIRPGAYPVAALVTWAMVVAFIGVVLRLALLPTVFYDDLVYHLGLPRQALLTGSWPVMPEFHYSFLPAGWDASYVLPLALGGGSGPQLMNVVALTLLVLTTHRIAWRCAGRVPAALATAVLVLAPMYCSLGAFAANDLFLGLALAVALDRLLESGGERAWEAGLLAAAAWGTKYPALPAIGGLALATVLLARGGWPRRLAQGVAFGATAVLVPAAWTLRTLLLTGNPLFPAFPRLLGGRAWDATSAELVARDSAHGSLHARGLATFGHALVDLVTSSGTLGHPSGINPAFPALALLGFLALRRIRHAPALLTVAFVTYVGWCLTSLNLRYALVMLVALVPFTAAAVGWALEVLEGNVRRKVLDVAASGLILLLCAPPFLEAVNGHLDFIGVSSLVAPHDGRGDFLVRRLALAAASRDMARKLPEDARVMLVGDGRLALLPRAGSVSSAYDTPNVARYLLAARDADDMTARVSRDFTHVLVNYRELKRFDEQYAYASRFTPEQARLLSSWLKGLPRVASWGEVVLYELPSPASASRVGQ